MDVYIQALGGPRYTAIALAAFLAYYLFATSPWWWSAFRSGRKDRRLPRRMLFSTVVAMFSYGLLIIALIPLMLVLSWILELPYTDPDIMTPALRWIVTASRYVRGWMFFWLPPAAMLTGMLVTHRLSRRWPAICRGLDA